MVCEDTLKVRNFPKDLSNAEKEDLLRHFGATEVKIVTSRVKQKSVAFAKFPSKELARNVLLRLHQLNVLNSRLVVEFAEYGIAGKTQQSTLNVSASDSVHTQKKYIQSFINKLNAFNSSVSFYQPPPSHLKYNYPKPNRATINNIAHALASIPKFYTQVLHLMNRMNLPPPFSDVPDPPQVRQPPPPAPVQTKQQEPPKNESSESEIESDPEISNQCKTIIPEKRKIAQKKMIKRPKFIKPNVTLNVGGHKTATEDVFERTEMNLSRKIEVKVSSENLEMLQAKNEKMEVVKEVTEDSSENVKSGVISEEELNVNRIPVKDLGVLPVFKNYHPGAPSSRLYIKNIAKTVEEKDLLYIFKRYCINDNNFDVKLMQEGRMKGQAFVTLDSVQTAQKALKETNGFILKDKPLVVMYAKSSVTTTKK